MKGRIFNIQRFSTHDGPNIRTTVFLKGCPLKCMWCHNPESIKKFKEIMWNKEKCRYCMKCVEICKKGAINLKDDILITDYELCNHCGECELYCSYSARQLVGKDYTKDELIKEILKDKIIFEESGGGVTFSGGEPLLQIYFLEEVMKELKKEKIHLAIDTCGYVNFEKIEKIIDYTDLFLYDLKMSNDIKHKYYTGVSNNLIIENLIRLSNRNVEINLRLPIIGGVNSLDDDIDGILEILKKTKIKNISILPYHNISKNKYNKLSLKYNEEMFFVPKEKEIIKIKNDFQKEGYNVQIGG
jgi:pyruvate formate lyase activating enzyme